MKFPLTKKDIIAMNQVFDQGILINEESLDFAISYARMTENWVKALAFLVRAINVDHVFEEGNKRTAALLIETYVEFEGHKVYKDKLALLIARMAAKRVTSIRRLEEMIKDVIKNS
ncbi:Fic family protein [Candidatus Woesearchaeota archaeon]|nr:Fic family protein [Candidatus Woesearchaeota archaeon]